jgi:hypothetical protein
MPPIALFGIENDTANTVVNLLVLFLAVLWLALVFWTYKDGVRRIGDPLLVATATATSLLFPFIGTIVYLILRPPEYLEDVRERELEIAASEARLLQMHEQACPFCAFPVEKSFLRCPSCLKRLKQPCASCRQPLDPRWRICPYCEAEAGEAPPQQRRRRRAPERGRAVAADRPPPAERAPQGERPPARTATRAQPAANPAPGGRSTEAGSVRRASDGSPPARREPGRQTADEGTRQGQPERPPVARPGSSPS